MHHGSQQKNFVGKNYPLLKGMYNAKRHGHGGHPAGQSALSLHHSHSQQPPVNVSDRITQRLSENIALMLYDKQYDKMENHALFVLTDLMKEYALEIGQEVKKNAELCGRAQPNLIDALVAAEEYKEGKESQMQFMDSNGLSLIPYKQQEFMQKANETSRIYESDLILKQNTMDRMRQQHLTEL